MCQPVCGSVVPLRVGLFAEGVLPANTRSKVSAAHRGKLDFIIQHTAVPNPRAADRYRAGPKESLTYITSVLFNYYPSLSNILL